MRGARCVRFLAPQPILHVPVGKTDLIYFAEQTCQGRLPITANKALGFERITFIHMHHLRIRNLRWRQV